MFRQWGLLNTYHGCGIQDSLEVDPHFGTHADLVSLVSDAHGQNMRVILDVVFNHSGWNWNCEGNQSDPPYRPWPGFYELVEWLDEHGVRAVNPLQQNDGVWPTETAQNSRSPDHQGQNANDIFQTTNLWISSCARPCSARHIPVKVGRQAPRQTRGCLVSQHSVLMRGTASVQTFLLLYASAILLKHIRSSNLVASICVRFGQVVVGPCQLRQRRDLCLVTDSGLG